MFGKTITLFRVLGFSVRVDFSWIVILALVIWSMAAGVFPQQFHGLHWSIYLAMGVVGAAGLFASVVVHELCHSLVARRYGLNMRGITLFIFGGMAEMESEPPTAKAEFLIAAAGPACSAVLGGLFYGLSFAGSAARLPAEIGGVLGYLGFINLLLAAFNLLPGFPLDGGRVLRSILWHFKGSLRKSTRIASSVGSGFGLLLVAAGVLQVFLGNLIGGVWWVLIGMFLRAAARQGYQQVLIRQELQGQPVRRLMTSEPATVPPSMPLRDLVEGYIYPRHFKLLPVVDSGRLDGCVTTERIRDVPSDQWATRTAGELAEPCSMANTITSEHDAMDALTQMNNFHVGRLMVVEDGRLVGIVTMKDLMRFMAMKMELEAGDRQKREAA